MANKPFGGGRFKVIVATVKPIGGAGKSDICFVKRISKGIPIADLLEVDACETLEARA